MGMSWSTEPHRSDFVTKYVNLLCRITDSPKEFQEAAALFLLSTAVGRKWIFRSLPETSVFGGKLESGKPLNLWFIILGKSRITRKTSGVLRHVEDICKKVFGDHRLISAVFTPEALIKEMSQKSMPSAAAEPETVCAWISDEIAWFFQHLKKKNSYMMSADAFLSRIYDGNTYSRSTIGRGKETIWNPYLTCLLASTTYLPVLFDELQLRLGFMNRFIYVIAERKERKPLRTEPLTEVEQRMVEEILDFLKALSERRQVVMLQMTEEAKELYDAFEEEIENRIANEDLGVKEGYFGNLPNIVVRLSCLYRISRMTPHEIRSYSKPFLFVEKQDVERAINYAWKAWAWFENVVQIMHKKGTRERLSLPRNQVKELVLSFLADGKIKQRKDIDLYVGSKINVGKATISNALNDLLNERRVCQPKYGFYKLKEDCKACKWRDTCRTAER